VDALVCGDDLIALGALQELRRRGVSVPRHLKVTGFDDTLASTTNEPSLTSVSQPVEQMAMLAMALITETDTDGKPQRIKLPATLVLRESSRRYLATC
jgi:LacI family transcriptional regulator